MERRTSIGLNDDLVNEFSNLHVADDQKQRGRIQSRGSIANKSKPLLRERTTSLGNRRIHQIPVTIERSPNDRRKYRVIRLENGIRCLLCCDAYNSDGEPAPDPNRVINEHDDKLAAASLCVGVGSFCDPIEVPGLAHFLEHMVFMGSEKYPEENAFDVFIKRNGGSTNAHTEYEHTTFFFDVMPNKFREALDRFSQFFISPLLREESVDREIEAIDNEFQMALPTERCRKEQLFCLMSKPGHPTNKFMWGNKKTLRDDPIKKGIEVHKHLKEFHKQYYSSNQMTVCIQAKYNLDVLQRWAYECFSQIPNNNLPRPQFQNLGLPYDTDEFRRIYKYVPAKNVHMLEITWALPCMLQHYKSKPLNYISWLLGHEGSGSLLSYLKRKLWATGISTWGGSYGAWEHNSSGAIFYVTFSLTEQGLIHTHGVILALFSYISMLKKLGANVDVFKQIKQIQQNDFNLQDDGDPCEHVELLSESMQYYPLQDIVTGDLLIKTFDPNIIKDCLEYMRPDRCNICIGSRTMAKECTQIENWCKTRYVSMEIDKDVLEKWKSVKPHQDFFYPEPNPFIATDFRIRLADSADSQMPRLINETAFSVCYYKKDTVYLMPRGYIMTLIKSQVVGDSSVNMALFDIWMLILNDMLGEKAYAATTAQLNFSLNVSFNGIEFKLRGFNHQLPLLFKLIVDTLANQNRISEDVFNAKKEQLLRSYFNFFFKPQKLNNELRLAVLQEPFISCVGRRQALPGLKPDDLFNFQKAFFEKVFFEMLFVGNIKASEAKEMEAYIIKRLANKPLMHKDRKLQRVRQLQNGESFLRILNFNKEDENCVITNYYQHGPSDLKESVINELLVNCMEEPCFDILRTREQLGYQVFVTDRVTCGILGFSVTVNSMINKFDMTKLNSRIDAFLKEVVQLLEKMSPKDFKSQVSSLITVKRINEDSHLGEETERYWSEMVSGAYKFDRLDAELNMMQQLSLKDVLYWLKSHVLTGGENHKKLSIQVTRPANNEIVPLRKTSAIRSQTEVVRMNRSGRTASVQDSQAAHQNKNDGAEKKRTFEDREKKPVAVASNPKNNNIVSSTTLQNILPMKNSLSANSADLDEEYNPNKVYELVYLPIPEVDGSNKVISNIQRFKQQMTLLPVSKITF